MFIAWRFFPYSEAPQERNCFLHTPGDPLPGFAPTERSSWACARSYKHLAPLERKRNQLLHSRIGSTKLTGLTSLSVLVLDIFV